MADMATKWRRLRAAVKAYDDALRAHGLLGTAWVQTDQLDRLWHAVLAAAELTQQPEKTS
jgi:hypothetical protein